MFACVVLDEPTERGQLSSIPRPLCFLCLHTFDLLALNKNGIVRKREKEKKTILSVLYNNNTVILPCEIIHKSLPILFFKQVRL